MLARELGMTVAELSRTMTAAEEAHWIAEYSREPFGDHRRDLGFAQICQILWNSNVKKENVRPLTDFLPFYRKPIKKDPNVSKNVRSFFSKLVKKDS